MRRVGCVPACLALCLASTFVPNLALDLDANGNATDLVIVPAVSVVAPDDASTPPPPQDVRVSPRLFSPDKEDEDEEYEDDGEEGRREVNVAMEKGKTRRRSKDEERERRQEELERVRTSTENRGWLNSEGDEDSEVEEEENSEGGDEDGDEEEMRRVEEMRLRRMKEDNMFNSPMGSQSASKSHPLSSRTVVAMCSSGKDCRRNRLVGTARQGPALDWPPEYSNDPYEQPTMSPMKWVSTFVEALKMAIRPQQWKPDYKKPKGWPMNRPRMPYGQSNGRIKNSPPPSSSYYERDKRQRPTKYRNTNQWPQSWERYSSSSSKWSDEGGMMAADGVEVDEGEDEARGNFRMAREEAREPQEESLRSQSQVPVNEHFKTARAKETRAQRAALQSQMEDEQSLEEGGETEEGRRVGEKAEEDEEIQYSKSLRKSPSELRRLIATPRASPIPKDDEFNDFEPPLNPENIPPANLESVDNSFKADDIAVRTSLESVDNSFGEEEMTSPASSEYEDDSFRREEVASIAMPNKLQRHYRQRGIKINPPASRTAPVIHALQKENNNEIRKRNGGEEKKRHRSAAPPGNGTRSAASVPALAPKLQRRFSHTARAKYEAAKTLATTAIKDLCSLGNQTGSSRKLGENKNATSTQGDKGLKKDALLSMVNLIQRTMRNNNKMIVEMILKLLALIFLG